jgi:CheY-like chemotaxis protein
MSQDKDKMLHAFANHSNSNNTEENNSNNNTINQKIINILFVDDQIGVRRIFEKTDFPKVEKTLGKCFTIKYAASGQDAFDQFIDTENSFDLIIMDYNMPAKDNDKITNGLEAANAIREFLTQKSPDLINSIQIWGHSSTYFDITKKEVASFDTLLKKPMSVTQFIENIQVKFKLTPLSQNSTNEKQNLTASSDGSNERQNLTASSNDLHNQTDTSNTRVVSSLKRQRSQST